MLTIPEHVAKKIVAYYEDDLQGCYFSNDHEVVDFRKKRTGETTTNPQGSDCYPALIVRKKRWTPAVGDTYWFADKDMSPDWLFFDNEDYDRNMIAAGNCFRTKEEAEVAANKLKKALQEVHS